MIAVPVSWQLGKTMPAATLAFLSNSRATNLSFALASGSWNRKRWQAAVPCLPFDGHRATKAWRCSSQAHAAEPLSDAWRAPPYLEDLRKLLKMRRPAAAHSSWVPLRRGCFEASPWGVVGPYRSRCEISCMAVLARSCNRNLCPFMRAARGRALRGRCGREIHEHTRRASASTSKTLLLPTLMTLTKSEPA
jgi:hypothetical protein